MVTVLERQTLSLGGVVDGDDLVRRPLEDQDHRRLPFQIGRHEVRPRRCRRRILRPAPNGRGRGQVGIELDDLALEPLAVDNVQDTHRGGDLVAVLVHVERARGAVVVDVLAPLECGDAVGVGVHLGARRVQDPGNLRRHGGPVGGSSSGHRQRQRDVLVVVVGLIEARLRRVARVLDVRGGEGGIRRGVEVVGDPGSQYLALRPFGGKFGNLGCGQIRRDQDRAVVATIDEVRDDHVALAVGGDEEESLRIALEDLLHLGGVAVTPWNEPHLSGDLATDPALPRTPERVGGGIEPLFPRSCLLDQQRHAAVAVVAGELRGDDTVGGERGGEAPQVVAALGVQPGCGARGAHGRHLVFGDGVQQGGRAVGLQPAERVDLRADPVVARNRTLNVGEAVLHHEFHLTAQYTAVGVDLTDSGPRSVEAPRTHVRVAPGQLNQEPEPHRLRRGRWLQSGLRCRRWLRLSHRR